VKARRPQPRTPGTLRATAKRITRPCRTGRVRCRRIETAVHAARAFLAGAPRPVRTTRIPQVPPAARMRAAARRTWRACRTYPARRRCPRFELNEQAARDFLARSLRREAGDLDLPVSGENWTLAAGWDLPKLYADETDRVENLVYQAIWEAGVPVITCTHDGVDIDLLLETPLGGDWMYQWRVSCPPGRLFALCNPYREEYRRLGWYDTGIKSQGCRTAMAILIEAVAYSNQLLIGYAVAGGRFPGIRRRPRRGIRH
jgi:hypothetical protein